MKVDYFIETIHQADLEQKMAIRQKFFNRYKKQEISLLARFLRFMSLKVPSSTVHVNIRKGILKKEKQTGLFVSIKDPFIRYLNHGAMLRRRDNY